MRTLTPDILGEGYSQITREQAISLRKLGVRVDWDVQKKGIPYPVSPADWDWDPFWEKYYDWHRDEYDVFFRTRTE